MPQTDTIYFSYNWNNKLQCKAFTTLRLKDCNRYQYDKVYRIELKDKTGDRLVCYARIEAMKHLKLEEITEFMAWIDTGYSRQECINMIKTMYKNKNIDWETQLMSFILLVKEKE